MVEVEPEILRVGPHARDLVRICERAVDDGSDGSDSGSSFAEILSQPTNEVIRERLDLLRIVDSAADRTESRLLAVRERVHYAHSDSAARSAGNLSRAENGRRVRRVHEVGSARQQARELGRAANPPRINEVQPGNVAAEVAVDAPG